MIANTQQIDDGDDEKFRSKSFAKTFPATKSNK